MKVRVRNVRAFWPHDLPRPNFGDIIEADEVAFQVVTACTENQGFPYTRTLAPTTGSPKVSSSSHFEH